MSGGQQITSGQGTLSVAERHGQEIISGQGFVGIGIGQSYALTGDASTSGAGTHGSARLVGLKSRKVGGGSAVYELTGIPFTAVYGFVRPNPSRTPTSQVATGSQGAFGKTRDRALTGSAVTSAPGTMTGTVTGASGTLTWTAASGATGYKIYWDIVSGPPYSNVQDVGNVTTYPTAAIPGLGTGTRYFNIVSYENGIEGPWGTEIEATI